jgi:hypothetical protein
MSRKPKTRRFIMVYHDVMDSEAWLTSSLGCQAVVLRIWRKFSGQNNGAIVYGRREVERDLRCGSHQAVRYLKEAQERGFIVPVTRGSFDWKKGARAAKATTWRLTMEPYKGQGPTDDWRHWIDPENLNDGCRSGTTTGAGAAPKSLDGCRSDTTFKTKYLSPRGRAASSAARGVG